MDDKEIVLEDTFLKEIYLNYTTWCIESGVKLPATKAQIKGDILLFFNNKIGVNCTRHGRTAHYFVTNDVKLTIDTPTNG